jgi:hypothetical protein
MASVAATAATPKGRAAPPLVTDGPCRRTGCDATIEQKEQAMSTAARSRHVSDRPERALRIEDGRVICPRRGLVDISRCWQCPDYRGMSAGRVEGLICGASFEMTDGATYAGDDVPAEDRPR